MLNLSASQLPTLAATEKPTVSPEALGSSAAATSIASYDVPQVLPPTPVPAAGTSISPTQAPTGKLMVSLSSAQCWIRLPTGCNDELGETSTPTAWFLDRKHDLHNSVANSEECSKRVPAYNDWCTCSNAEYHWGTTPGSLHICQLCMIRSMCALWAVTHAAIWSIIGAQPQVFTRVGSECHEQGGCT